MVFIQRCFIVVGWWNVGVGVRQLLSIVNNIDNNLCFKDTADVNYVVRMYMNMFMYVRTYICILKDCCV